MLSRRIPPIRSQALIGFALFVFGVFAAWQLGGKIAAGDTDFVIYAGLGCAGCAVAIVILRNWRTGFYLFLSWMMFEDLVRKYMGNGLALFFGKDILLALIYVSYYAAVRKGREKTFRPPFLMFVSIFFWLGVIQMFNPNSPSIWYGLLGIKMYFYYVPLMFIGYSLVRSDEELRKFLTVNALLAVVIASIGIAQSILGNSFLNPANLAPELEELGNLSKTAPLSGLTFNLPDAVFVSSGRYAEYVTLAIIVMMGAAGYLMLHTKRSRVLIFGAIGILGAAAFMSGSRGCFMYFLITGGVLSLGFLWGAPWRWKQAHKLVKVIRRSAIGAAAGLFLIVLIFPKQAGSRLAFYAETLLPNSSAYAATDRLWDYPVDNFLGTFNQPNWMFGNGIGTASLGTQYVSKLTGKPAPGIGVEEGFGTMILEMGLIAPLIWLMWSAALLYYSWKVVRQLRETRFCPIGLAIVWYIFLVLFPYTWGSLVVYENYLTCVYVWLLAGLLFRLPDLLVTAPAQVALAPNRVFTPRGFEFNTSAEKQTY
jgi:hypothetical protein